ncbi:MAG: serine--tRNA ligase, partial [Pelagibacteraceae bacterium]
MHNIKDIRKNYENFVKSLEKRHLSVDINKIKDLDEKNRDLIQKRENLEKEKK